MRRSIRLRIVDLAAVALAGLGCPAVAIGAEPSVAVTTVPATRGTLPDTVIAYGMIAPGVLASRSVSVAEPGRVSRVLVGPGQAVKRDAAILEWEQSSASRQAWDQAVNTLALAKQERNHAAALLERHLATRDQLDQALKAVADATATMDALRRNGADQPQRLLRSPTDGIVVSIAVAQGDFVAAGATLAVVASGNQVVLAAGAEPDAASRLRPGESARVTRLDGTGAALGTVVRVGAQLDPQTRLLPVDVSVGPNAPLPGEPARAEIDCGTLDGWLVPHAAVLQDSGGAYLFQVDGGKAARVVVRLRRTRGDQDLVEGALNAARPIVVDGNAQLSDGALLRVDGR